MLEGERIYLKPIDLDDSDLIVTWRNDKDINQFLFSNDRLTIEKHKQWFNHYINDDSRKEYMIVIKANNKKIGTIGLSKIDTKNKNAEYGILLGDKEQRGKGYAKEASVLLINHGFMHLELSKIKLEVFAFNENAIYLYKKIGFIEEGLLKKEKYTNEKFEDVMIMSIFKDGR